MRGSARTGMLLLNPGAHTPAIRNCSFVGNGTGLYLEGAASADTITMNDFVDNDLPLRISSGLMMAAIEADNVFTDNGEQVVQVGGGGGHTDI